MLATPLHFASGSKLKPKKQDFLIDNSLFLIRSKENDYRKNYRKEVVIGYCN